MVKWDRSTGCVLSTLYCSVIRKFNTLFFVVYIITVSFCMFPSPVLSCLASDVIFAEYVLIGGLDTETLEGKAEVTKILPLMNDKKIIITTVITMM